MLVADLSILDKVQTDPLYQWDTNQSLQITGLNFTPIYHFANNKSLKALKVTGSYTDGVAVVKIPNVLLEESYDINVYLYRVNGETGNTVKEICIPIMARPQPDELDFVE